MQRVWIGGWAIAPDDIEAASRRRWPDDEPVVFAPAPGAVELAVNRVGTDDLLLAYSTGAFLLLRSPAATRVRPQQVTLLAPFIDLRRELQLGGRVEEMRLRYMQRRLQRDPRAALAEFYQSAELPLPPPRSLPYALSDLAWGLEQLLRPAGDVPWATLRGATALAGETDPLIDAAGLQLHWPELRVVAGVGHDLERLLEAAP